MIMEPQSVEEQWALVAYLASKMGTTPKALVGKSPFYIVGVQTGGTLQGAVLYHNYRDTTIEMSCAGEPGWLTRAHLKQLFGYVFDQLNCFSVITMVERRNKVARAFNIKLGFTEKCVIEHGISGKDTVVHAMTRRECRWLDQPKRAAHANSHTETGAHAHG